MDDAYLTTVVQRFIVGSTGPMLASALNRALIATVEQIFGMPRPELLPEWRAMNAFAESRMTLLLDMFGYN